MDPTEKKIWTNFGFHLYQRIELYDTLIKAEAEGDKGYRTMRELLETLNIKLIPHLLSLLNQERKVGTIKGIKVEGESMRYEITPKGKNVRESARTFYEAYTEGLNIEESGKVSTSAETVGRKRGEHSSE